MDIHIINFKLKKDNSIFSTNENGVICRIREDKYNKSLILIGLDGKEYYDGQIISMYGIKKAKEVMVYYIETVNTIISFIKKCTN